MHELYMSSSTAIEGSSVNQGTFLEPKKGGGNGERGDEMVKAMVKAMGGQQIPPHLSYVLRAWIRNPCAW